MSGITWYDILGVLPSVSVTKIQREYDAKASLLRPELISGAPSTVVKAASRAQGILDAAWRVLRDPVDRELYDEEIGFRRSGEGLASRASFPSEPGWGPADFGFAGGWRAAGLLGALMAIGDALASHPRPRGRVPVTDHPMPVDGLVVDQSPLPPATAHRRSALSVQVWHPPMRPGGPRPG